MSQPSFADQITTFNALLRAIETRVAGGEVPREVVAEFKSSVDDLKEICLGLEDDLQTGALSPRHEDLRPLAQAANSLAGRIKALTGS